MTLADLILELSRKRCDVDLNVDVEKLHFLYRRDVGTQCCNVGLTMLGNVTKLAKVTLDNVVTLPVFMILHEHIYFSFFEP